MIEGRGDPVPTCLDHHVGVLLASMLRGPLNEVSSAFVERTCCHMDIWSPFYPRFSCRVLISYGSDFRQLADQNPGGF